MGIAIGFFVMYSLGWTSTTGYSTLPQSINSAIQSALSKDDIEIVGFEWTICINAYMQDPCADVPPIEYETHPDLVNMDKKVWGVGNLIIRSNTDKIVYFRVYGHGNEEAKTTYATGRGYVSSDYPETLLLKGETKRVHTYREIPNLQPNDQDYLNYEVCFSENKDIDFKKEGICKTINYSFPNLSFKVSPTVSTFHFQNSKTNIVLSNTGTVPLKIGLSIPLYPVGVPNTKDYYTTFYARLKSVGNGMDASKADFTYVGTQPYITLPPGAFAEYEIELFVDEPYTSANVKTLNTAMYWGYASALPYSEGVNAKLVEQFVFIIW